VVTATPRRAPSVQQHKLRHAGASSSPGSHLSAATGTPRSVRKTPSPQIYSFCMLAPAILSSEPAVLVASALLDNPLQLLQNNPGSSPRLEIIFGSLSQ
jgi:hypothetical protein